MAAEKITLGLEELQQIISTAVREASKSTSETLAQAILEARKPYKDPAQEENDRVMRENMRETQERIRKEMSLSQDACPHKQGCNPLSEFQSPLSSFVTHTLDTSEVIGVCTNCGKIIRSTRQEDLKFFRDKSANRRSSAGQRSFLDPMAAQRAGAGLTSPRATVSAVAVATDVPEDSSVLG